MAILTDTAIRNAKPQEKSYKIYDSQGLYLLVKSNSSKLWYLKFHFDGKEKKLAFGAYPAITLAKARDLRENARTQLANNVDPSLQKQRNKQIRRAGKSFEDVARDWISNQKRWSMHYTDKTLRALEMYLFPAIGKFHIADITTVDLLQPLKAVEALGYYEVASRLQGRLTSIMRHAVQHHLIKYNPALDLKGVITQPKVTHHPALALQALPDLVNRINHYNQGRLLTRLAVKLNLLLFIRSSELRFARWSEIDFNNTTWIVPAEREPIQGVRFSHRGAKMKTPHNVPLSTQAITLLKRVHELSGHLELVFPGDHNPFKPMSEGTINKALQVMGYDTKTEICGHGFRTMACSALAESGLWSSDAIERQMSHKERNSVKAAYIHKAEHLEMRKEMMQWWADYVDANQDAYIAPYEFK